MGTVSRALEVRHAEPGDLFVQKSPASTIGDLAKAMQQLFGDTGVRIIGDSMVNLQVTIREKTDTIALTELPIEIVGLARKQKASLSEEFAGITLSGRVSLLAGITRGDIVVYADVTGLAAGTYEVKLAVQIDGEDLPSELQCAFTTADTVHVTIEE